MNKLWLFLAVILLSTNAGALDPCAKDYRPISQRYTKGIAFLVQKCGGKQNVIAGTMHSDAPDVYKMHENALPAIKAAKAALFEVKMDNAALLVALKAMYYPADSGKTLSSVAGDDLFEKFQKRIGNEDPMNEKLKPWAAAVMLQYPKNVDDGVALDLKLQKFAQESKVNVAGLESINEQLDVFNSLPEDKQVEMLKDILDNYELSQKMQDKLVDSYKARDLKALQSMIPESLALSSDPEEAKAMLKLLIDDRNIRMADRMQPYFDAGSSFVAIGALHLPGDIGVLKLLEDKGYKVETLY